MSQPESNQPLSRGFAAAAGTPPEAAVDLEERLRELCTRGADAWPSLPLDRASFCGYLGERLAPADLALAPDRIADAWLACACVAGIPGAADAVIAAHGARLAVAVRKASAKADVDDVLQRLWEYLLVPSADRPGRLAQYRCRGPLAAFLRVAAVRMAISQARRRTHLAAEDEELERLIDSADDPELEYLKALYVQEFRQSLASAMDALEPHYQLLLRLEVVDKLTVSEAATIYGRSRSTTGRHLIEARERLATAIVSDLKERLALADSEVESVARLVRSRIAREVPGLLSPP